jgi:hypothetical protein
MDFTKRIFPPGDPRAPFHTAPDDMIDVWRVQTPGDSGGCIVDNEAMAREMAGEDPHAPLEVWPQKMSRSEFENLREFAGF